MGPIAVGDVISFLETDFPLHFQESWDNSGLQIGSFDRIVDRVVVSLDVDQCSLEKASSSSLIISHHPLFFKPLKSLDFNLPLGSLVQKIINLGVSVYSAHTNLDVCCHGVSDELASLFEILEPKVLKVSQTIPLYKLVVYVPVEAFEVFRLAMLDAGLGHIGAYSHCSFSALGEGTFKPGEATSPYIGQVGQLSKVSEYRFESIIDSLNLSRVLAVMKQVHPYEEVAYDVIKLDNSAQSLGFGRYGVTQSIHARELENIMPGVWKGSHETDRIITSLAVCGGSGGDLVEVAVKKNVQCLVTGDVDYHQSCLARDYGLLVFDVGHRASESVILEPLRKRLQNHFGDNLQVIVSN